MLPTMFWFIWQSGFRVASYHVLVHLAKDFFKSAIQKQELLVVAMFVNGSRQNEQSL